MSSPNNSDILMLGILQPPEEVGVYRIAAQVAMLAAILMQILRTLSAPRIAATNATAISKPCAFISYIVVAS